MTINMEEEVMTSNVALENTKCVFFCMTATKGQITKNNTL